MTRFITMIALTFLSTLSAFGHGLDEHNHSLKHWDIENKSEVVEASFLMFKDGIVSLEKSDHSISKFPLDELSVADQEYVLNRQKKINSLNNRVVSTQQGTEKQEEGSNGIVWFIIFVTGGLIIGLVYFIIVYKKAKPMIAGGAGLLMIFALFSFKDVIQKSITDPVIMDTAFDPFKPNVSTFWDDDYFYVESNGIPDHEMMVGIGSNGWQQQVPIQQCYYGTNAWMIPLNPVVAATPVPVDPNNFTRGAIAVAVNGISIFNPYTNAGVDAYLDGQLDNFGGHCGRADDYHYHTAPLFLYSQTAATQPIAFGLDGFAVYGDTEPDGTPMATLDANNGHYLNGVYHYHGTASAPYMIGNMVGEVVQDATNQIIPQPAASAVRPDTSPLGGATITSCVANAAGNGYTLMYTLNNETYTVDYNWTANGTYTYNFISPSGTVTETYNGHAPCDPLVGINDVAEFENFLIYPNPAEEAISISLEYEDDVNQILIIDAHGKTVYSADGYQGVINLDNIAAGTYHVQVEFKNYVQNQKLIIK